MLIRDVGLEEVEYSGLNNYTLGCWGAMRPMIIQTPSVKCLVV